MQDETETTAKTPQHEIFASPDRDLTLYLTVSEELGSVALKNEAAEHALDIWRANTNEILEFPSVEEGLDMDGIRAARERMGVTERPLRFLSPEDYQSVLTLLEDSEDHSSGRYLYNQDVLLVKRDPSLEALNGPGYTESLAVHEMAHSGMSISLTANVDIKRGIVDGIEQQYVTGGIEQHPTRAGFIVKGPETQEGKERKIHGSALEEGYAELERGIFNISIGRPNGFGVAGQEDGYDPYAKYSVLSKTEKGEVQSSDTPGASVAVILEVLIEKDPEILDALRRRNLGGRDSVDGHREFIQRVNHLVPGLYKKLRQLNHHDKYFSTRARELYDDTLVDLDLDLDPKYKNRPIR
ncbi:MAG TPA: hypothetical protein VK694_02220 [Verrucomicrobiae bacterium]|nr:hypothetical protein [Verrucomicrobiae bacterium]